MAVSPSVTANGNLQTCKQQTDNVIFIKDILHIITETVVERVEPDQLMETFVAIVHVSHKDVVVHVRLDQWMELLKKKSSGVGVVLSIGIVIHVINQIVGVQMMTNLWTELLVKGNLGVGIESPMGLIKLTWMSNQILGKLPGDRGPKKAGSSRTNHVELSPSGISVSWGPRCLPKFPS